MWTVWLEPQCPQHMLDLVSKRISQRGSSIYTLLYVQHVQLKVVSGSPSSYRAKCEDGYTWKSPSCRKGLSRIV